MEEAIRRLVGVALSEDELDALARWYSDLSHRVAAFPEADLRQAEPPLRSEPGPRA